MCDGCGRDDGVGYREGTARQDHDTTLGPRQSPPATQHQGPPLPALSWGNPPRDFLRPGGEVGRVIPHRQSFKSEGSFAAEPWSAPLPTSACLSVPSVFRPGHGGGLLKGSEYCELEVLGRGQEPWGNWSQGPLSPRQG